MEQAFKLLSLSNILDLPWMISVPGLLLILLSLFAALISLLRLRILRAFVNLVWAFTIAVILSQAGSAIAQLIGLEVQRPAGEQALIVKPASPSDFRYTA